MHRFVFILMNSFLFYQKIALLAIFLAPFGGICLQSA